MSKRTIFGVILVCFLSVKSFVDARPGTDHYQNVTIRRNDNLTSEIYMRHTRDLVFIPFAIPYSDSQNSTCNNASDEDDFPHFMDEDQILHGGIVLVILIGIYGFSLLATVCGEYFVPCVEIICVKLNITPDVTAATFMSIATSTPEFFTNVIATFVTESDLGIGTIVGSSLCNALLVPAIGGLAAPFPLLLDWYPLSRDCVVYVLSVCCLIGITWDGYIYWYETLISLSIFILNFVIMFNNKRISAIVRRVIDIDEVVDDNTEPDNTIDDKKISKRSTRMSDAEIIHKVLETIELEEKQEEKKYLFRRPEGSLVDKIYFYYVWPIRLILKCTIPNPVKHRNFFPVTFVMCIVWIGINSYLVSWMIEIIGAITKLPDALLGMTIIAAGSCLPEAISMTIIARKGEGAFGVSNSLGANTMNVLYSLGLPWLLKSLFRGISSNDPIQIQSGSLEYTIMSLILAVTALYLTLLFKKFRLSKISGVILLCVHASLITSAILTQTLFIKKKKC